MALTNLGLGFVFTATNLASGTIRRLRSQVGGLGRASRLSGLAMKSGFAIAAAGIVPLVVGLGALAIAMNLANAAAEFEQGLAGVGAVPRATTEEIRLLRDAAIQAGILTQFSPTEAVEGLNSLATAGQTARQATETLIPVLDLAAGSLGQLGVGEAAQAVVGTLNAYSLSADEAVGVTDRLLRITQLSNFQARDFATGLSKAAAVGAVFGQELNDVLITMGLLRNANIDASSSATAFREATRRLGSDQNAQRAVTEAGVDVFDEQTGEMRQVVDILQDLAVATEEMTDRERNRIIAQALGARGLLAFNAVAGATVTTMREGREVTLAGADAIEFLRKEMNATTGTAEDFRDTLLDTFAGQKTLLEGTLATFAVVLGEPFARIFKPLVAIIVDSLNFVLRAFENLPDGMKDAVSGLFVAAAAFSTVVGVVAILTGLFLVLLPFMKLIGIALGVMALALAPFIAGVGAAIAAVAAFRALVQADVGGVGSFMTEQFRRIKLAWDALVQLFTQGGFSGAVLEEFGKVNNQGLFRFVINLFRIGSRIIQFFSGIQAGFDAGLTRLGPTLERFVAALTELGEAFGFVGEGASGIANKSTMDDFASTGIRLGEVFADVLGFVVTAITQTAKFWTGFVKVFMQTMEFFSPVFKAVSAAFERLGSAIADLFAGFDDNAKRGEDSATSFGEVIGRVFGVIATVAGFTLLVFVISITEMINLLGSLTRAARSVGIFFASMSLQVENSFLNVVDSIRNAIDTIMVFIGRVMSRIPAGLRPAFGNQLIAAGQQAETRRAARRQTTGIRNVALARTEDTFTRLQAAEQATAAARESQRGADIAELTQVLREQREFEQLGAKEQAIVVAIEIDGEKIAEAAVKGNRTELARGFVPGTPAETV